MRKLALITSTLLLFSTLSGCAYVNTRAPYDDNLEETTLGTKIGTASNYSLLWLFAWGDASYAAAAANGDIEVLKHSDVEYFTVLFGLYMRRTIIVYGD
ncbi:MAG: hypothetical protein C0615_10905 [Desulfuromonas sp.]|nr:MAG: hypothetical protein C0615_10905 [Desulfuromonas sp.]